MISDLQPASRESDLSDNPSSVQLISRFIGNGRECPSCGLLLLFGIPGGRDAVCNNCGYKDPCCSD